MKTEKTKEKMVPLSAIDKKIKRFQWCTAEFAKKGSELDRIYNLIIEELEDLKKKAI